MVKVTYNLQQIRNPRHKRLAKEHIALDALCMRSDVINYEIVGEKNPVPTSYLIHYQFRSIIGIDSELYPLYGETHSVQITLTNNYPIEPARCYAKSEIWHPNIKSEGKYKGRICSNTKEFGKLFSLDMLALRIGEMLQYKNYHALNIAPYPEDEKVAKWVREYAEPKGIINYEKGIAVDNSLLVNPLPLPEEIPLPEQPEIPLPEEEQPKSPGIRIKKTRTADTGHIKIKKKGPDSKS